ncbi:MAG: ABC transporter substrate-binding protein [Christensenellaceae bacterium]|jgi:putative ABC transport system substrate-binding protein|nr:ABC transporter substrate-binding protein [Christensenellaceae bacterium]
MKKILCIVLSLMLALSIVACAKQQPATLPAEAPQPATPDAPAGEIPEEKIYTIGIIQLTQHAALDAACSGFVDGINASDLNVIIDIQNAQGEQSICSTIATKFVNDGVDLILAITTPAAQSAAQATKDIPILITAVTDPVSAGLVLSNEAPGGNVSGTSDMNPVAEQAALLYKLVPEAKTVGIMYHSSEDNSIIQANLARTALEALGLTVQEYTVADSNDVQAVTQSAVGKVDALYIPTDNLLADTIATVSMIATPAGIPIICGESNMVNGGGTATYGISYKQLGLQTAAQAIKILGEGVNVGTIPIEYCNADLELVINPDIIAQLGITVPADLK